MSETTTRTALRPLRALRYDTSRVALIGVLTGLLAAVIASLAVLRQPPWPKMTFTDYR